jgi:MFS family permease
LLLIRALQGVVSAMVWPVAEAALMDIVGPKRRAEGLGLYMMVSNIGFIVGPGLGGLLYNFSRDILLLPVPDVFRVPYFIAALIVLPAAILTAVLLKETAPGKLEETQLVTQTTRTESVSSPPEMESEEPAKTSRMMRALYIMTLANGLAMGLGQPVFQLFLMSKITSDIGLIGFIISGAGAIGMLFSIPAGRYADRHGRKGLAVYGALGARASLAVIPLTTNIAQVGATWVAQAATMSVSQPALRAIQADVVPWRLRGKLFGTIQAFFNAGATVGPLLGGVLYAMFSMVVFEIGPFTIPGFVVPFWLAAGLGVIAVFILWAYVDETRFVEVTPHEADESITDVT